MLFPPQATLCLISVGCLADEGITCVFECKGCTVRNTVGKILAEGARKVCGLYTLIGVQPCTEYGLLAQVSPSLLTWHKGLGHIGYGAIIDMAKLGMTKGMPTDLSIVPPICEHCILSKQAINPVPHVWEGERAKAPLEIIYLDLTGPEDMPTPGRSIYLMNIIDDYSSFPWGFILKKKSDAEQVFQDWKTKVERGTGHRIGIVRTNGGGEYSSSIFEATLQQQGIEHQTTAPYMSAQNRKSERMH